MVRTGFIWINTLRQVFRRGSYSRRVYNNSFTPPPPPPPRGRRSWIDGRVLLAFTSAAGFSFQKNGIPDSRMKEAAVSTAQEFEKRDELLHGWEKLVEEQDLRVFRRRVDGPFEMYEYKCAGTYRDISPRTFLDAQNDIGYRNKWDSNIITLEMLKEDGEHELIRWVARYPYPMYPREYIYARRTWVSDDVKMAIVDSEVIPTELLPSSSKNVRVATYTSRMAVRAHSTWEDHGLDYILTYSDNPEANIPRYVYNWIVNQGGPYFLKQVHQAAKELENSGVRIRSSIERARKKTAGDDPSVQTVVKESGVEGDMADYQDAKEGDHSKQGGGEEELDLQTIVHKVTTAVTTKVMQTLEEVREGLEAHTRAAEGDRQGDKSPPEDDRGGDDVKKDEKPKVPTSQSETKTEPTKIEGEKKDEKTEKPKEADKAI